MPAETILTSISTALADVVDTAAAAVVQVRGRRARPTTGTVIANDRVLVVDHTIDDEDEIVIRTGDGRTVGATLAGGDPATDLALLRAPALGISPLGDAPEPARVGHLSLALGRAPSGRLVAGAGIISAVGATYRAGRGPQMDDLIITHAGPFQGFSGGAIVDTQARLIGVGNAGLARGTALVLPIRPARRVAEMLDADGRVRRGYLGLSGQMVRLAETQRAGRDVDAGLLVVGIAPDSPAARAGLFVGDIVIAFGGVAVSGPDDLVALLTADRVGKQVAMDLIRAGAARTLQVTVGER